MCIRDEHGQATLEWTALVLLVGVVLAGLLAFVPVMDGRPLGAALARAIVCAVKRDCAAEHAALVRAYGERDAHLVRMGAPGIAYEPGTLTLPVDWRRCRSHECADAPDDRDLDVTRAEHGGAPATAFTHVIRRGGRTYIQYWFYYPDSITFAHLHSILTRLGIHSPGSHQDDWEGYQLRIDPDGSRWVRATAHGGYQWCKSWFGCHDWGPETGWTRVSRGSHAGHIPLRDDSQIRRARPQREFEPTWPGHGLHERSTAAPGLRLVPIETLDKRAYHSRAHGIAPPWQKRVYRDPAAGSS